MYLSKQESKVIGALFRFWRDNLHTDEPAERVRLASGFISAWENHVDLAKKITKHPATRLKMRQRAYSVLDILADFIISAKQREEKEAEYAVHNPDKEYRTMVEPKLNGKEMALVMGDDIDDGIEGIDGYETPAYSILEYNLPEYANLKKFR